MKRFGPLMPYVAFLAVSSFAAPLMIHWERSNGSPIEPELNRETLNRKFAAVYRANMGRVRIGNEVIAQRLSLLKAAEQFRDVSEANPDFDRATFRRIYQGASDHERFCRQVISAVAAQLGNDADKAVAIQQRLSMELEHELRRGPIRLALSGARELRYQSLE